MMTIQVNQRANKIQSNPAFSIKVHSVPTVKCVSCTQKRYCLPSTLKQHEINPLESIVDHTLTVEKRESLFSEGQPFDSVYIIRTGSFKTYTIADNGVQNVIGFHQAGEALAMNGISHTQHRSTAEALERSSVCQIPFTKLEKLAIAQPELQHNVFHIMSREINKEQAMLTLLSSHNAEEKVATFLFVLSQTNKQRHMSPTDLYLTMSRGDIANYLGITVETVSRTITRLQEKDILHAENKAIHIIDLEKLKAISNVASFTM